MVALGLRCWLLVAVLDGCCWGVVVVGMVVNGGDIDNENFGPGMQIWLCGCRAGQLVGKVATGMVMNIGNT